MCYEKVKTLRFQSNRNNKHQLILDFQLLHFCFPKPKTSWAWFWHNANVNANLTFHNAYCHEKQFLLHTEYCVLGSFEYSHCEAQCGVSGRCHVGSGWLPLKPDFPKNGQYSTEKHFFSFSSSASLGIVANPQNNNFSMMWLPQNITSIVFVKRKYEKNGQTKPKLSASWIAKTSGKVSFCFLCFFCFGWTNS